MWIIILLNELSCIFNPCETHLIMYDEFVSLATFLTDTKAAIMTWSLTGCFIGIEDFVFYTIIYRIQTNHYFLSRTPGWWKQHLSTLGHQRASDTWIGYALSQSIDDRPLIWFSLQWLKIVGDFQNSLVGEWNYDEVEVWDMSLKRNEE